jgi:MFS family permease
MIAPASGQLAEQFGIHSSVLLAMTTSVFVLGYGATCCIHRRQPRLIAGFHRHLSFWSLIPWPTQRDIRTLSRPTNFQPVVSRYVLSLIPIIAVNGPSLVWNIACGFAQSKNMLIAFRFLAGLGGSAPLSIGGGVIGDLFDAEHRGQAIAIYSLAPLLGPAIGPVAGAWIAEKSTWRWVVRLCSAIVSYCPDIDERSSGRRPLRMRQSKD